MANTVPEISIIIPTLNEEEHIGRLIRHLTDNERSVEIIVADGNSTDRTVEIATKLGAQTVAVHEPSRPKQLNAGADLAKAELLYFVHADTLPPRDFAAQILDAAKDENTFGSFRFKFNSDRPNLKFNSWCTRLPVMMVRGGDQSLFISQKLFTKLGGYREDHIVMEDYDIIRRGKRIARFQLIQDDVIVSARKYEENPYWWVNISNFIVFSLYYFGVKPDSLKRLYLRLINHPKA
ncbi:TIGR04283 family arsenosugar biosynthesis glycosyltransferase [Cryomorphaceae bacterium 1068]|nr:TIGR04283 family arsenosugar biosynthesis glycosyltransferase [Cryomorphaceae bacterium 1068]